MSLDVYLTVRKPIKRSGTGVFVRDGGRTRELTAQEVAEQFEGAKIQPTEYETAEVFEYNITHNLGKMADAAGVYYALWRPEEKGWKHAADIIKPLEKGLVKLRSKSEYFATLNPENGWGSYEGLVTFVELYLNACKEYPDAEIGVSR